MSINPAPDLMQIFDFTAADLEANRAGKLTERQVQRLSNRVIKNRRFLTFAAVAMPIYMLLSIVLISGLPHSSRMDTQNPITLWIPVSLIIVISTLSVIFFERRNLKLDVQSGIVNYTQGTMKRWSTRGGGSIKIGGTMLDIEASENIDLKTYLKKVSKDSQFRVYFVPKSKRVVAVEKLD